MAPPPNTPSEKPFVLKATYRAPPQSDSQEPELHNFRHPIPASLPRSDDDNPTTRVAYLAQLRDTVPSLQAEVNTFLTEKMDRDKALAAQGNGKLAGTGNAGRGSKKEQEEEDLYGEEIMEDDE